jgi:hypothetical protein
MDVSKGFHLPRENCNQMERLLSDLLRYVASNAGVMCRSERIKLSIAVILIFCLAGVSSGLADLQSSSPKSCEASVFEKILVLPFQNMSRIHGENRTLRGPLSGNVFITGEVAPKAELIMDRELHGVLVAGRGIKWQSPESENLLQLPDSAHGVDLTMAIQQMGRHHKSDAILVGYLYTYRERQGGDFGAQRAARVAFELVLICADNGAIVWRKGFSETQKALNENLLEIGKFIKRKGRWVTARDMGKQAMQEMLKTFPNSHQSSSE